MFDWAKIWQKIDSKVWLIFGCLFLLRVLSVVVLSVKDVSPSPIQDPLEYKILSQNITQGEFSTRPEAPFVPQLLRTPGYPLFLAMTNWLGEYGPIVVQQILIVLTGFFLFILAKDWLSEKTALILTAIFLLEPMGWMLSLQTMSETVFMALIYAAIFCLWRITHSSIKNNWYVAGAGLLTGLALLVRPARMLWVPGLVLWLVVIFWCDWKKLFINLSIFGGLVTIVLLPWIWRNYELTENILLSSSGAYNTVVGFGNQSETDELFTNALTVYDNKGRAGATLAFFETEKWNRLRILASTIKEREGLGFYTKQLQCVPKVWFRHDYPAVATMAGFSLTPFLSNVLTGLDSLFSWILLISFGLGLITACYKKMYVIGVFGVIIGLVSIVNMCVSYTRMLFPVLPLVLVVAAMSLIIFRKKDSAKKSLLIVTQIVDYTDTNLGFFHNWLQKIASKTEHVYVICLKKGKVSLPKNVTILSLGKEEKKSRWRYLGRFYWYIWLYRQKYGSVLVHMNPEYAILGGGLWRLWNKKIALWYVHKSVNMKLRLAEKFATDIFTTSAESFRLSSKKVHVLGHGIDVGEFLPHQAVDSQEITLFSAGRITRTKDIKTLIKSVAFLKKSGYLVSLEIAGDPILPDDQIYLNELQIMIKENALENTVVFLGGLNRADLAKAFQRNLIFVHASQTGSTDKVVLEALAAGCLVITSSLNYGSEVTAGLVYTFPLADSLELAKTIEKIHNSGILKPNQAPNPGGVEYIKTHHNLDILITKILSYLV